MIVVGKARTKKAEQ